MNPTPQQEKAKELVDKFISIGCLFANAKNCALLCVDEIIKAKPLSFGIEFWEEVKKEITNL